MRQLLLISALALTVCTGVQAQTKSTSNAQIPNMAMISPESTRQVLQRLVGMCSVYGRPIQQAGSQAFSGWIARHQALLDESQRARQEFLGPKPNEADKMTLDTLDAMIPQIVDAQVGANATSINDQPTTEAKASRCRAYMKSIDEGAWELRTNDPTTFKFLQDRIDGRNRSIPTSK